MDAPVLIERLDAQTSLLRSLLDGVTTEEASWKPTPESWSILEVAAHLLDEERMDFRVRIDYTLHRPGDDWPPIDPAGWVTSRNYADWDLNETLQSFLEERRSSIEWLRDLGEVDWSTVHTHPKFGSMSAGELFGAWVAHDLLHARQLVKLHFKYTEHLAQPYSLAYAGDW